MSESMGEQPEWKTSVKWLVVLIALLVSVSAFLLLSIRTFVFQLYSIPSESNIPNLVPGDRAIVLKFSYGYSRYSFPFGLIHFRGRIWEAKPKYGDLVAYRSPKNPGVDFIKRVVGVPGDRIKVLNGVLQINGVAASMKPIVLDKIFESNNPPTQYFRETLPGGASHIVANITDTDQDNTEVYMVPPGSYFMLGDNRDNSMDSRFVKQHGYIPAEYLIGKVVLRFAL